MKTKSKVFAKVMAIVLAVVMACSSAVPAFAAAASYKANRADKATTVGKNWVDWVELLNDDACEAMLDAADEFLKDLDLTHFASSGQKDDTHTLPMVMPIDSSMNSMLQDDGYVHVFLGNQKLANGKYPTGGSTGTSDSSNTDTATAPGINRVYLYVKVHAKAAFVNLHRTMLVSGYADSVDGIIDLLCQLYKNVINNSDLELNLLITTIDFLKIAGGDQVARLKTSLSMLGTIYTTSSNSTGYYQTESTDVVRCGKSWRKAMGAKKVMKMIAQLLDALGQDNNANNILYSALSGTLALGALNDTVGLYYKPGDDKTAQEARDDGIIGGLVTGDKAPIWDTYESDGYLLYNGLAAYVMNHELPTANDGEKAYYGYDEAGNKLYTTPSSGALTSGTYKYYGSSSATTWKYDKVIFDCISQYLLQDIVIDVTYPEYVQNEAGEWVHDSSMARFKRGDAAYDSNLKLNKDGKVYLFRYGNDKLWLKDTDNLYTFAMSALKLAWKTVLKPTLHLLQINYNGHEIDGKGTNFDNAFLKWYIENKATGTVRSFPATAYTDGSVDEWAAAVYADYGAADAAEFLENVKGTYDYDEARTAKNDAYNWRDVEVTSLFNMVRYSPLADKYFNVRTGPANLYFLQTGTANIDAFMDAVAAGTKTYAGIPEALNDFLIEVVKDVFPNSANIGYNNAETGDFENIAAPSGFTASTTFNANTIMNNIYKVLEYVANTTDADLLNPYYAANSITYDGSTVNLTKTNIEEALIPFGIAVLKQWNLTAVIHNSTWDKVSDLESGAVVALQEYLGYLFPDRDYSSLWKEVDYTVKDKTYKHIVAKTSSLYDEAILLMARDAAAYAVVATGTPVTKLDSAKTPWDPYTMSALNDTSTTIWDLANSVGCYFLAVNERFDTAGTNAKSKGIAALFGLGTGTIKSSNSIWTNLDAIFNKILPVSGELQYKYTNKETLAGAYKANGAFESQEFIENILIADVMDFDLTNLLDGVYRILAAAPIKTRNVHKVLYYDILAPVLNSILGANSLNSGSAALIPTASVDYPIDTFLLPANVRGSSYTNGIVSRLLHNLRLYFDGGASEYFYDAATFLFMTLGMPGQLQQHEIGGVDIKVYDSDLYTTSAATTIKIKNNSYGINRFFHNQGDLNASKQYEASRYWVNLKSAYVQNASGTNVATLTTTATSLAPEKCLYFTPSWTATRGSLYKVVATYDIKFDDTLTNGTATAAAAASTTIASNLVATKWIYVPPTSYTQTWANQGSETFDGKDFKTKDGAYTGQVTTGTAANNIQLVAGSMYDVTASDVASEGYGVRLTNNTTSDINGKFYVYPTAGMTYVNRATGANATVAAAAGRGFAFLAIDEEGNIYNKDGSKYGNYEDNTDKTWIMGYHKTTNLEGEEVYDYILANAWNTPATVAFGAPGAGTTITDLTSLAKKESSSDAAKATNIALFKSGSTLAAKYNVGFAFCTSASARAYVETITLAYCGNMDALKAAVDNYADVSSAASAVQEGAKAACIRYRNSTNVEAWTNADALTKAIQDAGEAAVTARAAQITDERFGTNGLDNLDEVDYKIVGHREFRKYLEKYEGKLVKEAITEEKNGEEVPVLDAKGRETFTYKAEMPQYIVDEYVRTMDLYKGYMEERAHDLTRVKAEVIHATSPCDDYDEVGSTQNDFTKFTTTKGAAERKHVVLDEKGVPELDANGSKQYETSSVASYRFAYSTKEDTVADNVDTYTEIATTATDVKFGAVEGGKLVNNGETKYTDDSWNAYIDALGEVIDAINANAPISKTYTATTHLVMAENELEPADEPASEGITVAGTVVWATATDGTAEGTLGTSVFGARGIKFQIQEDGAWTDVLDDQNNVVFTNDTSADDYGKFSITVPAGTTEIRVVAFEDGAEVGLPRTVTLSGDADVADAYIPYIISDYNCSGSMNVEDTGIFNTHYSAKNKFADLNNSGSWNVEDKGLFSVFKNKRISYTDLALD